MKMQRGKTPQNVVLVLKEHKVPKGREMSRDSMSCGGCFDRHLCSKGGDTESGKPTRWSGHKGLPHAGAAELHAEERGGGVVLCPDSSIGLEALTSHAHLSAMLARRQRTVAKRSKRNAFHCSSDSDLLWGFE